MDYVVWLAVITAFVSVAAWCGGKARKRGLGEWLKPVGRQPRDLFADRRVNFVANVIHEWMWIGFAVAMVGFVMFLPETTDGDAPVVFYLGIATMLINALVRPFLFAFAGVNPKYGAETPAPSA